MTSRAAWLLWICSLACAAPSLAAANPLLPSTALKPAARPLPKRLAYTDGDPIPPGYRLHSELRTDTLIAGGIVFWAAYSAQSAISFIGVRLACELQGKPTWCDEGRPYYPLFIPVAGPFIFSRTPGTTPAESAGLIAIGTLQIAGIETITAALTTPRKVLVRSAPAWTIAPQIGRSMIGLKVAGTL